MQMFVVTAIVAVALAYAVRALAPAAWLAARLEPWAGRLTARGWPRLARWVSAYAPAGGSCHGCSSCAAQGSATRSADAASAGAAPDAAVHPVRIIRPRPHRR